MKPLKLIGIVLVFILVKITQAQDTTIIEGAYRNPADFINKKILFKNDFKMKKLGTSQKFPLSYKVTSNNGSVRENDIMYGIWAIYSSGCLYVNALRHGLRPGYIKVNYSGNYCYLNGLPMLNRAEKNQLNRSQVAFGLVGLAVTGADIAIENRAKRHHVLNIKKGTVNRLTREYIERIIREDKVLHKEFLRDLNGDSIKVFRAYLHKINERNLSFE